MPGIRGFVPDALLAYDGLSPAGSHSAAVARRAGVPLFVAEQGFPTRGRPVERGLRWVGERLWGPRVRRSLCGVVALDDLAQAQALEFGVAREQVHLVPGGIDPALHRRGLRSHLLERHGVRGHVVLAAGPLLPGRGLRGLVRAYAATLGALEDWTLVIAGEGIPAGNSCPAHVSHVDAWPFIMECVGEQDTDASAAVRPGISLNAFAAGANPDRAVLSEYHGMGSATAAFMLRFGRWKYVHYVGYPSQLFDLQGDPEEIVDLGSDPAAAAAVREGETRLRAMLDPEEIDARVKRRQADLIAANGGREAVIARGDLGFSVPLGVTPQFD